MKRLLALCTLGVAALPGAAHAVGGPSPSAVSPATLKLPDGPGSVQGLPSEAQVKLFTAGVSYELPLDLPDSLLGFSPRLSFTHSGELGHGVLGVGWTLTTVSIRRVLRDGVPAYLASDELEIVGLGGGDLVPTPSGELRVQGGGNILRVVPAGEGFLVSDGDGLVYELGTSAAGRLGEGARVAEWFVERVSDPRGQTVRYRWERHGTQQVLAEVIWGPGEAFRAQLAYEPRPDRVTSWRTGFLVETTERLKQVQIVAFGAPLRRYELAYDDAMSLGRLAAVRLVGRNDQDRLPAVTFSYAAAETAEVVKVLGVDGWALNARGTSFLDIDSDGLADLVRLEAGNHQYRRNLGGRFDAARAIGGWNSVGLSGVRLVDLDGDSHAEMVRTVDTMWREHRLVAGAWQPMVVVAGSAGVPLSGTQVALLDVNGDRRTDVLRSFGTFNRLYLATPKGLAPPVRVDPINATALGVAPGAANVRFFDVNGDNLDDAVWLRESSLVIHLGRGDGSFVLFRQLAYPWGITARPTDVELADLNRDGLMDLLRFTSGHVRWYRGLADGGVVAEPVEIARPEGADSDVVVAVADGNGNGSQDVVWSSPRGMWLLDLAGATTASMLVGIDNGMGKTQRFAYRASSQLMLEDEAAGRPWRFELPISLPVPTRVELRMDPSQPVRVTENRVRDGFWDVEEHRFGGFLGAERVVPGDSAGETLRETISYHQGLGEERVLRGKIVESRRQDGAGRVLDEQRERWAAVAVSGLGGDPRLRVAVSMEKRGRSFEGSQTPVESLTTCSVDEEARVIEERAWGRLDRDGDELVTWRRYASDDVLWIRDRTIEERVTTPDGALVAAKRIYYQGVDRELPLGEVGLGSPARIEDQLGSEWLTTWQQEVDASGRPLRRYEEGVWRRFEYDASGLYVAAEHVTVDATRSLSFRAEWDVVLGKATTVTGADGVTRHVAYDGLGRPIAQRLADLPPHTIYEYDWERAAPRTTVWEFDGLAEELGRFPGSFRAGSHWRQTVRVSDGAGNEAFTATRLAESRWIVTGFRQHDARGLTGFHADPFYWDGEGLPVDLPAGTPGTRVRYDAAGRAVEEALPDGAKKRIERAPYRQTLYEDGRAPVLSEFDGAGRVVASERTVGGILERVTARYDGAGRLTEMALAGGRVSHRFEYDSFGRLVFAHDPDIGARRLSWDAHGRLVAQENGAGQITRFEYDGVGRLLAQIGAAGERYDFHYDEGGLGGNAGRLAWVDEPTGKVELAYDAFGRQVRLRRTVHGESLEETATLSVSGRPLGFRYDDGLAWTIEHDEAGRPVRVGHYWQALELDAAGRVLAERYGNGVVQRQTVDARGQATSIEVRRGEESLYRVLLAHNAWGGLVEVDDVDGRGLDHSARFSYDEGARLSEANLAGWSSPETCVNAKKETSVVV